MALVDIGKHLGMFVARSKVDIKNTDGTLRQPTVIERYVVDERRCCRDRPCADIEVVCSFQDAVNAAQVQR